MHMEWMGQAKSSQVRVKIAFKSGRYERNGRVAAANEAERLVVSKMKCRLHHPLC